MPDPESTRPKAPPTTAGRTASDLLLDDPLVEAQLARTGDRAWPTAPAARADPTGRTRPPRVPKRTRVTRTPSDGPGHRRRTVLLLVCGVVLALAGTVLSGGDRPAAPRPPAGTPAAEDQRPTPTRRPAPTPAGHGRRPSVRAARTPAPRRPRPRRAARTAPAPARRPTTPARRRRPSTRISPATVHRRRPSPPSTGASSPKLGTPTPGPAASAGVPVARPAPPARPPAEFGFEVP